MRLHGIHLFLSIGHDACHMRSRQLLCHTRLSGGTLKLFVLSSTNKIVCHPSPALFPYTSRTIKQRVEERQEHEGKRKENGCGRQDRVRIVTHTHVNAENTHTHIYIYVYIDVAFPQSVTLWHVSAAAHNNPTL